MVDVPDELELDPEHRVTPIDVSDVCVNYWTSELPGEAPTSLDALYVLTHAATEAFNPLEEEWIATGGDGFDTIAREVIAEDFRRCGEVVYVMFTAGQYDLLLLDTPALSRCHGSCRP